ncbi:MAG: DNA glycosylase [Candidatus Bathyarchaeia archaeon]|jgi:N-glycosylase/DNA lyase
MELKLNTKKVPFSLDCTLDCGQLFRWQKMGDWWYGVVLDHIIKIRQDNELLTYEFYPSKPDNGFIENYLRLDDDLPQIFLEISKDEHIQNAINLFSGLRLVRQDPWECLISYICATYKSIPAIKKMVNNISECFGKRLTFDGYTFYTFPTPEQLTQTCSAELRTCGLGFRTDRVLEAAKMVENGSLPLDSLKQLSYKEAKKQLLTVPGVGDKVADCVLLFSLDKLEAFPIDVWVKRVATTLYADHFDSAFIKRVAGKGSPSQKEYKTIADFGRAYFGKYVGYAQEYLFHYLRTQQQR